MVRKKSPDVNRPTICLERLDMENYKSECDLAKADLKTARNEIDELLSKPDTLEFYQEKPVVGALAVIALISTILLISSK